MLSMIGNLDDEGCRCRSLVILNRGSYFQTITTLAFLRRRRCSSFNWMVSTGGVVWANEIGIK